MAKKETRHKGHIGKPSIEADYSKLPFEDSAKGKTMPTRAYPPQKLIKDRGYMIPTELKNHKVINTNGNALENEEFAPFDFRTSTATGPLAVKNRILAGRLVRARLSGMSYSQIAKNFGINPQPARRLVVYTLADAYPEEDVDMLRNIANAQYDKIIESWYTAGTDQMDEKAAKVLLAAIDAKRKLHGTDYKPVKETKTTIEVDLTRAATEVLERYGNEIIDVEVVEESAKAELPMDLNPAVESLLSSHANSNVVQEAEEGEDKEVVLVDEEFLETLEGEHGE